MNRRREIDYVLTATPTAIDAARAGADRRVWRAVTQRMDQVAEVDSIAFRVGSIGRIWRVAVWIITAVGLAVRSHRTVRRVIQEGFAHPLAGWQDAVEASRDDYKRIQLLAAVGTHPEVAVDKLEDEEILTSAEAKAARARIAEASREAGCRNQEPA